MNSIYIDLIFFNFFVVLIAQLLVYGQKASEINANNSSVNFEEYRTFLPADIFDEFVRIHSDNSLLLIDKLKQLNTIFVELPARTLAQIPLPRAFRRLPLSAQTTARRIYYSKWMPFEEKLTRLDALVQNLQRVKTPVTRETPAILDSGGGFVAANENNLPLFVEFDVPVLLHFNGKIETSQLQRYLSPDEFDLLIQIVGGVNGDQNGRSRLVGRLLKEAYAKHGASYFPSPQMRAQPDDSDLPLTSAAEDVTRLGIHLMFGRNDYDNLDSVASSYQLLKSGVIDYKSSTNGAVDNSDNGQNYADLPDISDIDRFYRRRHSGRQHTTEADDFNKREMFSFKQTESDALRMRNYHAIEMLNDEFTSQRPRQRERQQSPNENFDHFRDFVASFVGNIHV